uniref:Immunoglobulin V-set domain-containing protein n=1 Tax=Esox lucius TaxID=8010 RepID=A0A3P8ZV08_ESOLU
MCLYRTLSKCVSSEDLTPLKYEEYSLEGTFVTLFYKYSRTAAGNDFFFWYRQDTAQRPEFLQSISGGVYKSDPINTGISVKLNGEKKRVDLEISSAEVTDSALYYCAQNLYIHRSAITLGPPA